MKKESFRNIISKLDCSAEVIQICENASDKQNKLELTDLVKFDTN